MTRIIFFIEIQLAKHRNIIDKDLEKLLMLVELLESFLLNITTILLNVGSLKGYIRSKRTDKI